MGLPPQTVTLLQAAREHAIDLAASWFVGDKPLDIECGRRAGTRTIQVRTGYGASDPAGADFACEDAVKAVELVLLD